MLGIVPLGGGGGAGVAAEAEPTASTATATIAVIAPSSTFLKLLKSCSSPVCYPVVPSAPSSSNAVACTTRALPSRSPLLLRPRPPRPSRRRGLRDTRWSHESPDGCTDAG